MRVAALLATLCLGLSPVALHATSVAPGVTITNTNLATYINGSGASASGAIYASTSDTTSSASASIVSSPNAVSFAFNQNLNYPDTTTETDGSANFFTTSSLTYTLLDAAAITAGDGPYIVAFDAYLKDLTTGKYLYDTNSGGPLSGVLVAGDKYLFSASATLRSITDPTLAYNPSIAFGPAATSATPEPSSLVLLGTGLLGVVGTLRRRSA